MNGRTMAMAMVATAAALSGCVGGAEGEQPSELLAPPPDEAGVQLALHAPADRIEETTLCQLVALPVAGLDVGAIEHRLSEGAVALEVRHTALDAATTSLGRVECGVLEAGAGRLAFASGEPEGVTELPDGMALRFAPGEVVLLEARFRPSQAGSPDAVGLNLWIATEPPARTTSSL